MATLVDPDDAGLPDEQPDQRRRAARVREAETRRRELVANAGHELKTPLSIILGLSGRLLSAMDERSAEHRDAGRIRANAYGLLKQVDDLLQAARIEDGRVDVDPVDCDVAALVRDAASGFQSLMEDRDQRLVLRTPGRLPARIDETKLGTVVTNLLANAVRHAPPGGVVRCSVTAREGTLRIEVADSGPGVPEDERDLIFERFRQTRDPGRRRAGGTGLGLAIVRELVTLLGGTVTVGDAPERGALFAVELGHEPAVAAPAASRPLLGLGPAERERATVEALKLELQALDRRRAVAGARPARRAAEAGLPRVLLVEPSATLGVYLEELLGEDYDVRRAGSAEEALRLVARTRVEAVVVDVGAADGEALLAAVAVPELDGVPVVVLAGDPEQAQILVRERADDYAVKPFAETLLVRLGSVVGRRRAESARAAADARFRAVFEHAPTGMALATPEGRLLEVNAALVRLLGLARGAPASFTLDALTHPDDLLEAPASLVPAGDEVLRLERRLVATDGRVVPATLTISAIREDGAAPGQLVVQVEEARARGREAWVLVRVLATQLARCVRYDERAALLLVEIDEPGDDEVAARLRTAAAVAGAMRGRLRRSDVLVPLGERRFAALLVNVQAPAAMAVAGGVRAAVEETSAAAGAPLHAAVGVCAFDASATAARIMAEAESALLRARRTNGVAASGAN